MNEVARRRKVATLELGCDDTSCRRIGKVDGRNPFGGPLQLHIAVQNIAGLAVCENRSVQCWSIHRPGSDKRGDYRVAAVDIVQVRFDKGRADLDGLGIGHERSHPGPCAIRTEEKVGLRNRAVHEHEFVPSAAKARDVRQPFAPADHAFGQRVEDQPAQGTAEHFGTTASSIIGLVNQHDAFFV